jgi:hypothetical protein
VVAGDRFLLCSDGLSGYFEEDPTELAAILNEPDSEAGIHKLVDLSNERGGKDNITGIIVTVGDASARDEDRAKKLALKREMLVRMPLFRPLNDREILRVLEVTGVTMYQNGERVISEGGPGCPR